MARVRKTLSRGAWSHNQEADSKGIEPGASPTNDRHPQSSWGQLPLKRSKLVVGPLTKLLVASVKTV